MAHRHAELVGFDLVEAANGSLVLVGIDEVGMGPLAGPVVVAGVALDFSRVETLVGVDDSKKCSAKSRASLQQRICDAAFGWAVVSVPPTIIDRLGLSAARVHGVKTVMDRLRSMFPSQGVVALLDGVSPPALSERHKAVVGGDRLSLSIAAASILAKVHRDEMMGALDLHYPGYDFGRHKGYGTKHHMEAIAELGPCPEHRRSFAPVARSLDTIGST